MVLLIVLIAAIIPIVALIVWTFNKHKKRLDEQLEAHAIVA